MHIPNFSTVKIEFEKAVAMQALHKEIEPEWHEQIKRSHFTKL